MKLEGELEQRLLDEGYRYFEPMKKFGAENPKTLILGSAPGVKSGKVKEYYANKGNNFWKVMEEIFGTEIKTKNKEDKKQFLNEHGIVLWDVFKEGYRKGSKDKDFKHEYCTLNTIKEFIEDTPSLKQIVIAGKTANKQFKKHIGNVDIPTIPVTSTSGQNGYWKKKKHEWLEIDW